MLITSDFMHSNLKEREKPQGIDLAAFIYSHPVVIIANGLQ